MSYIIKFLVKVAMQVDVELANLAQREPIRAEKLNDALLHLAVDPRPTGSYFREVIHNTHWERRGYHAYGFIIVYLVRDATYEVAVLSIAEETEDIEFS